MTRFHFARLRLLLLLLLPLLAALPTTALAADPVVEQILANLQKITTKIQHGRFDVAGRVISPQTVPSEPYQPLVGSYWLDGEFAQTAFYKNEGALVSSLREANGTFAADLHSIQPDLDAAATGSFDTSNTGLLLNRLSALSFFRASPSPKVCMVLSASEQRRHQLPPFQINYGEKERRPVFNPYLPLLMAGRPKLCPPSIHGACMYTRLLNVAPEKWEVIGEEKVGELDCVKLRVERMPTQKIPLNRHSGEISANFYFHVWCSKSHGLLPIQVSETVPGTTEYSYDGKAYPVLISIGEHIEVLESFELEPGLWYPRELRVTCNSIDSTKRDPNAPQTADDTLDHLIANGSINSEYPTIFRYAEETRVIAWTPLESHSHSLWINAPKGILVGDEDAKEFRINGLTQEESDKRRGIAPSVHKSVAVKQLLFRNRVMQWLFYSANGLFIVIVGYYLIRRYRQERSA